MHVFCQMACGHGVIMFLSLTEQQNYVLIWTNPTDVEKNIAGQVIKESLAEGYIIFLSKLLVKKLMNFIECVSRAQYRNVLYIHMKLI